MTEAKEESEQALDSHQADRDDAIERLDAVLDLSEPTLEQALDAMRAARQILL
jgi:hypothetical protein